MKDPSKNASLASSFTFTGTISDVRELVKVMQILIHQNVLGKLPTDYKLIVRKDIIQAEEFPYIAGDTVLVEDAVIYEKDAEMRLTINQMSQIRATTAQAGELNTLTFSGEIVEVFKEEGYLLVRMKQEVLDYFPTTIDVVMGSKLKLEAEPKAGDIGLIRSALFYDKDGCFRAKITRPTYKVLYSPDAVMSLGNIEAKEVFC